MKIGEDIVQNEAIVKESDEESQAQTKSMTASRSLGRGTASPYAVTGPGSPVRKRYHTAPREKHRVSFRSSFCLSIVLKNWKKPFFY